ncbi:OmpA family protein [Lysobacter sp. H21R4]|uniref:OmpA family protein n=1 Tax=Lysobacter sp. H21R4 TaxID=2781021 RepID=UPI0018879684|nr:OmpA family protein [Lysobacter sp. H21R4]QOY62847.1 OmpA family protein [Lysobacter sp. H21R4]
MRSHPVLAATGPLTSWLLAIGLLLSPAAALAQSGGASGTAAEKPVVATGTVPDEATRAAILQRLRELYGANRVVDRIEVDAVIAPPNWSDRVLGMLGPDLKQVSGGELAIDGNSVRITGQVGNEAARQQVASAIATGAGPSYVLKNSLVGGGGSKQDLLDQTLADRIIEFKSGSATLTDGGRAILDEMAVALERVGQQQVQVIGHTDSVGSRESNIALSLQRAIAVKAYLEQRGVSSDNLSVQGFGPDRPVADNDSDDGRARNRRIEFRVM